MQWKQGVVVYIILQAVLLYNTTPIHCTPLPLHPPVMDTRRSEAKDDPRPGRARQQRLGSVRFRFSFSVSDFSRFVLGFGRFIGSVRPRMIHGLDVPVRKLSARGGGGALGGSKHVCVCVHMCVHTHTYIYIYICIYVYMYICIYVYVYICICICIRIYIYIHVRQAALDK